MVAPVLHTYRYRATKCSSELMALLDSFWFHCKISLMCVSSAALTVVFLVDRCVCHPHCCPFLWAWGKELEQHIYKHQPTLKHLSRQNLDDVVLPCVLLLLLWHGHYVATFWGFCPLLTSKTKNTHFNYPWSYLIFAILPSSSTNLS